MTVFILRQINLEEKAYEATTVSIHSTRELALKVFNDSINSWNSDLESDDEYFVNPRVARDEMISEGFFEMFNGAVIYDLTEYEIDSGLTL